MYNVTTFFSHNVIGYCMINVLHYEDTLAYNVITVHKCPLLGNYN